MKKLTGLLLLIATVAGGMIGLPSWLLKGELLTVMAVALIYSLTAFRIRVPAWVMCPEFRGVVMVALGGAALFIDPRFLLAAALVGQGARLVMTGFTDDRPQLAGGSRDLVVRPSGAVATRDYQS